MQRDGQVLAWTLFVCATMSILVGLWGTTVAVPNAALRLSPNPLIGVVLALLAGGLVALPSWPGLARSATIGRTPHGMSWKPEGAYRQVRSILAGALAVAVAVVGWQLLGPARMVDMAPFLKETWTGIGGCSANPPPIASWALDGMCLWDRSQVIPLMNVGAYFLLGSGLAFLVQRSKSSLIEVVVDGAGIDIVEETGRRRLAWDQIEDVGLRDVSLAIDVRDEGRIELSTQGLDDHAMAVLYQAIKERLRPETVLSDTEQARLAGLDRMIGRE